jgi:hypothetical protein
MALDLHLVASSPGQLISASNFMAARATRHWQDEAWLNDNLENHFILVEKPGAQSLVDALHQTESRTITTFNERADAGSNSHCFLCFMVCQMPRGL